VKVGDVVVRAYAFHDLIPGIIVEETVSTVSAGDGFSPFSYDQVAFTVAWSDDTLSSEMYEELIHMEGAGPTREGVLSESR
jgi:hypothetical protein